MSVLLSGCQLKAICSFLPPGPLPGVTKKLVAYFLESSIEKKYLPNQLTVTSHNLCHITNRIKEEISHLFFIFYSLITFLKYLRENAVYCILVIAISKNFTILYFLCLVFASTFWEMRICLCFCIVISFLSTEN